MPQDGRDEQGRFIEGAPPGPGRPPRRDQSAFLKRLVELCNEERLDAVFVGLIADAVRGKTEARKLLLAYLLGKPSGAAPTPTQLVIEDEAQIDPLAFEILLRRDEEPGRRNDD